MSVTKISTEAIDALNALEGDLSEEAAIERAYWEKCPTSVKYVRYVTLSDNVIDLVWKRGIWR